MGYKISPLIYLNLIDKFPYSKSRFMVFDLVLENRWLLSVY